MVKPPMDFISSEHPCPQPLFVYRGRLTKMLGRKVGQKVGQTVTRIKSAADERLRPSEEEGSEEEALKVKTSHRSTPEFDTVRLVQEIASEHTVRGVGFLAQLGPAGYVQTPCNDWVVNMLWTREN